MEAGPKPSQLKLLQAQCSRAGRERQSWDLQKQFAASLLSLSSTRLRFQRSDSCSLFFLFGSLWTTNSSRKRTEMTWKDCAGRERIQSICEMKSLWRHTGSCLGYCLRKDSNECLWHGHIRKLKHWALSGLARWIILFISRWWSTGNLVSGFVLFPEIDRSFALVFTSELHDTFCYLRVYCDKKLGLLCLQQTPVSTNSAIKLN